MSETNSADESETYLVSMLSSCSASQLAGCWAEWMVNYLGRPWVGSLAVLKVEYLVPLSAGYSALMTADYSAGRSVQKWDLSKADCSAL